MYFKSQHIIKKNILLIKWLIENCITGLISLKRICISLYISFTNVNPISWRGGGGVWFHWDMISLSLHMKHHICIITFHKSTANCVWVLLYPYHSLFGLFDLFFLALLLLSRLLLPDLPRFCREPWRSRLTPVHWVSRCCLSLFPQGTSWSTYPSMRSYSNRARFAPLNWLPQLSWGNLDLHLYLEGLVHFLHIVNLISGIRLLLGDRPVLHRCVNIYFIVFIGVKTVVGLSSWHFLSSI